MPRLNLDDLIHKEPRRAARWVQDHLPDVPRLAERGGHDAVEWVQARLPTRRDLQRRAPDAASLLWPTVIAAAGAGAAFWWWTSWSRGRDEAEREARASAEGAAHPDAIMAHAPPPEAAPPQDPHPAEDEAAPDVMAHAPPPAPTGKGKLKKVKPVVAPKAAEALQRNLAVQAAGDAPPKPRKPKAAG